MFTSAFLQQYTVIYVWGKLRRKTSTNPGYCLSYFKNYVLIDRDKKDGIYDGVFDLLESV